MVYAFTLPTTSPLSFQTSCSSLTHPSLPQSASTARHALRLALKAHKRLPRGPRQDAHLPTVLAALNEYIPYLFTISRGLSSQLDPVLALQPGETIDVFLHADFESAWQPTLFASTGLNLHHNASTNPSSGMKIRRPRGGRITGRGIHFEIAFTLTTLGYVLSRLARIGVQQSLYAPTTPSPDQHTAAIQTATRNLLQASAVHTLLASCAAPTPTLPDIDPGTQSALSALALAEATLLAVLKDDAYVTACIQARNLHDREWMVRAPAIPKVRALLFARLCVRAAEYAEQAAAGLSAVGSGRATRVDEDVTRYAGVLGRVARARACRFFGIDAETAGRVGEGIAWLRAARTALGLRGVVGSGSGQEEGSGAAGKGGFSRLKREWAERREEKKIGKDAGAGAGRGDRGLLEAGDDAGRDEEGRVIAMLETKWMKMNDTVSFSCVSAMTLC